MRRKKAIKTLIVVFAFSALFVSRGRRDFVDESAWHEIQNRQSALIVSEKRKVETDSTAIDPRVRKIAAVAQANYCLAIRGNGELEPAHWGAIAQVVEHLGWPEKQAGGSSASITMFWLESMSMNKSLLASSTAVGGAGVSVSLVSGSTPVGGGRSQANGGKDAESLYIKQALMVKSLHGFLRYLETTDGVRAALDTANAIKKLRQSFSRGPLAFMRQFIAASPDEAKLQMKTGQAQFRAIFDLLKETQVVNSALYVPLLKAYSGEGGGGIFERIKKIQFYLHELDQSITLLGQFDARTDANLFYREGLVSFDKLAVQFGRAGDFYERADLASWLELCAPISYHKAWSEFADVLLQDGTTCGGRFTKILGDYFAKAPTASSRLKNLVGENLPTYVATAVLVDGKEMASTPDRGTSSAFSQASDLLKRYDKSLDPNFGEKNIFSAYDGVRFGYWGPDVKEIEKNLKGPFQDARGRTFDFSDSVKVKRFMALPETKWQVALSLSPAEPGLSRWQKIPGTQMYSSGGWTDLHPVQVLKAAGCESVVYVTRKGGDSVFAQGVGKRLLGYDRSWENLATSGADAIAAKTLNAKGDASDQSSLWSQLFNLANPKSGFNQAIKAADLAVCTNWDQWNIFSSGPTPVIDEAYSAPLAVIAPDSILLSNWPNQAFSGFLFDNPGGQWNGCLPSGSTQPVGSANMSSSTTSGTSPRSE